MKSYIMEVVTLKDKNINNGSKSLDDQFITEKNNNLKIRFILTLNLALKFQRAIV